MILLRVTVTFSIVPTTFDTPTVDGNGVAVDWSLMAIPAGFVNENCAKADDAIRIVARPARARALNR